MTIALLGYMGSGKSSIGKLLAEALTFPFVDLDHYIEKKEGMSVSAIFESRGELYFRKQEARCLQEVIKDHPKAVLSLGGGTPCYGTIMDDLLKNEEVITLYLKASVETLTNRLWPQKEDRPLIAHLPSEEALNEFIRKHLFERSFFYNQANIKLVVDDLSRQEVVQKILLTLF